MRRLAWPVNVAGLAGPVYSLAPNSEWLHLGNNAEVRHYSPLAQMNNMVARHQSCIRNTKSIRPSYHCRDVTPPIQ